MIHYPNNTQTMSRNGIFVILWKRKLFDQGISSSPNSQVQVGLSGTVSVQQAASQPSIIAQIQAKEADVQALSELTRVLDKKVVHLVSRSCIILDVFCQ